ncbi:MAG: S8 family serine peptidase [Planctomycetota bacterium]
MDDVAHQAHDAGTIATGDLLALHGHVGGDDHRDVYRLHLGATQTLQVRPSAGLRVEAFETATATCVGAAVDGQPLTLASTAATAVDVVVASASELDVEYRVEVAALEGGPATAWLPLTNLAAAPASALQVGYVGADHEMIAGEVIVTLDEEQVGIAADAVTALGLRATRPVPGPIQRFTVAAPMPPAAAGAPLTQSLELQTCLLAHRAARLQGVVAASPNYVYRAQQVTPNDSLYPRQWHYPAINAPQAWALFDRAPFNGTPGSASVIVAIVDTGMVLAHPDFAGRLISGYDMISDPTRGLDGDGIDPNPDDPGDNAGTGLPSSFHGTHVGGTVGATSNNSVGVAGMDWACKLMPIRVLGRGGSGSLEDIAQGIRFAAGLSNASGTVPAQRCDVMNMSLGGPGSASVLQSACEAATSAGVLLVVAAGNDGTSTPNFPASYDVCLSVGSIRVDYARAPYSNFASTVDVVAPGGDTSVDQNQDGDPDGVLSCLAADGSPIRLGFGFLQGTSMACPHVAGLAALVKGAAGSTATAAQVRAFIEGHTFSRGGSTRIVDAFAAVQAAFGGAQNPVLSIDPGNLGLQNGTTTATVALSNVGDQSLLTLGTPTISYQTGTNWITAAAYEGTGSTAISNPTLRITIDRTGLADGQYDAIVTLPYSWTLPTPGAASGQLPVTMFVGTTQQPNDEIFVLVVHETNFSNLGQTQTNAAASFQYSMPDVPTGRYYLVAGTDRDNDDFIGDEGEWFGIWPSNDSPLVLEISGSSPVISGLNFTLQQQNVQLSVGGKRAGLPPLRLRR